MRFDYLLIKRLNLLSILTILLTGCMVGPDFHKPPPPPVHKYTNAPLPHKTTSIPDEGHKGKSQYFLMGRDVPAEWWHLFKSPQLDYLIRKGIANNPNLEAAIAALRQSQELLQYQISSTMFPLITGQFSPERQRFSSAGFGNQFPPVVFNLFNASVNVTYTLDIFGGLRRQIESARAQVDYQRFQVEAAYLTLTSNIVTTAMTIASLRGQIAATEDLIHFQDNVLTIVNKQYKLGGASALDVDTQKSQVESTRATLPPLQQNLAKAEHALAVLTGEFPSEAMIPKFSFNKIDLPGNLPVSIPSNLVQQRPDIRASEALMAVASAKVGVATANLYPQFTINPSYGWTNDVLGTLLQGQNVIWNYGGTVMQTIFDAGALRSQQKAAVDAFQQAWAQYRQTVLVAFQNVADVLRALQHDAETLKAQRAAEIAARDGLKITQQQYYLGGVSYLALLIAQRQYQLTRISRIQVEGQRYVDTAALFAAVGGGWWNRGCCNTYALMHQKGKPYGQW